MSLNTTSDATDEQDRDTAVDELRMRVQKLEQSEFGRVMEDTTTTDGARPRHGSVSGIKALIQLGSECRDGRGTPVEEVLDALETLGVDRSFAGHEIEKLRRQGEVYEPAAGRLEVT